MLTRCLKLALLALTIASIGACQSGRPVHVAYAEAEAAFEKGEFDLATPDYEYVIERRPGSVEAKKSRVKLARCYLFADRPAMAREQLEAARTQYPDDPAILDLMADTVIEVGDAESLHETLTTIARERNQPEDWRRLGRAMAAAGDMDEAERAFQRAAIVDRGHTLESQLALARFYQDIGDDENALKRLRMALYIDPSNEEVRALIRDYGAIPGPTYAIRPAEWR